MTPEALAALHAACFTETPRPWTAAEFATFAVMESMILVARPEGFALGHVAGPDAELLTLAVHPDTRRRGIARGLIAAFEQAAQDRGARDAYLEVAETNDAARALYAACGYAPVGRRPAYYTPSIGPPIAALVHHKRL
jgi:[ribosomal protein S18]-alanine N-acetyltransferase